MNKVGIISEDSYILCPPSDMIKFFQCLKDNKINDDIIVDRLYKRYLELPQLDRSIILLNNYKRWLQGTQLSIAEHLVQIIEKSKCFYIRFNDYVPVRIGIPEMPSWLEDKFRDLSEYDNLQGPPFWLREYLQKYPDTVLPFE